jgi:hypothetical protein
MSVFPLRRVVAAAALAALLLAAAPERVSACSICRCGDPTFNSLGTDVYSEAQFRIAFDFDRFNKSQLVFEDGHPGTDHEIEYRYTTTFSYGFGDRFLLVARLPVSHRDLTTTFADEDGGGSLRAKHGSEEVTTTGMSDPEFYALVRLWSSRFGEGLGKRSTVSAIVGVKTPWGQNDVQQDGVRVDEHAQPGTGSTDLFGGVSGYYLLDERSTVFGSVQYRGTGRNDFGYKYGDITNATLAYERKLSEPLDAVLEFDFRHAGRDQVDFTGEVDPNTGGTVLYITPRLLFAIGPHVALRAAVQIPIVENLYGVQDEKVNVNGGVTLLF